MVPGRWRIPAASGREYFATAGHTRQLSRHSDRADFSLLFYFLNPKKAFEADDKQMLNRESEPEPKGKGQALQLCQEAIIRGPVVAIVAIF